MVKRILGVLLLSLVTSSVFAAKAKYPGLPKNAYLDGGESKVGVILAHGRGRYPTWDVVNPLRKGIHKELGYHTLSLQMPTGNVGWKGYIDYFPDAYKRIQAAIDFLKKEKKVEKVYLMGHSMGSRMATGFLAEYPDSGVAGFIGAGIRNGGDVPLNSYQNLKTVTIPIIDIYGDGGDGVDNLHADRRAEFADERENYTQVFIKGADHLFSGYRRELVKAAVDWLKQQNQ